MWLRLHLRTGFSHAHPDSLLLLQSLSMCSTSLLDRRSLLPTHSSCLRLAFQMHQGCPALWLGTGDEVSYPDGEVTHPPGKHAVESSSAGCPLPFSSGSVVKSPGNREGFFAHRPSGHVHLQIYTLPVCFNLGVHSPMGSQQCTLLLDETRNQ